MRVFGLFLLLLLVGCSDAPSVVKLYDVADFEEIKNDTLTLYTEEDAALFEQAVANAVQLPGIPDMFNPMYLLVIHDKSYYLWLYDESGTLLDAGNTHIVYTLTEQSAKALIELIKQKR